MKTRDIVDGTYRILFRAGFQVALFYWHLRQPTHQGALVAVWMGRRLLFVRQSYRRSLSFPGGGLRPGEPPREAARRELAEELALLVAPDALTQVYQVTGLFDGRRDTVYFFELRLAARPIIKPDNREIVHAQFIDEAEIAGFAITGPVARYLEWRERAVRGANDPPVNRG
jgi:8-oxo-dGTP diphosphatase